MKRNFRVGARGRALKLLKSSRKTVKVHRKSSSSVPRLHSVSTDRSLSLEFALRGRYPAYLTLMRNFICIIEGYCKLRAFLEVFRAVVNPSTPRCCPRALISSQRIPSESQYQNIFMFLLKWIIECAERMTASLKGRSRRLSDRRLWATS